MPTGSNAPTASAQQEAGTHMFPTGAKRSARAPRYDLLVHSLIQRIAERAGGSLDESGQADGGALKYGEGNWERGLPTSDVINHVMDHMLELVDSWRMGLAYVATQDAPWEERMEQLRGGLNTLLDVEDHIGAVGWGLMVLCHQLENGFHHDPLYHTNTPPEAHVPAREVIPPANRRRRS
jgi:hypothetical protein